MSASVVILRDHVEVRVSTLVYNDAMKQVVAERWFEDDNLLMRLQSQPIFAGRRKLSELEPYHFRVLLALHLTLAAEVPSERREADHPVLRNLDNLFIAMIHCMETRLQGTVSTITVNRVSETNVIYEVAASLSEIEFPKPRQTSLRIIVDNG
jgi:hypothetical protein